MSDWINICELIHKCLAKFLYELAFGPIFGTSGILTPDTLVMPSISGENGGENTLPYCHFTKPKPGNGTRTPKPWDTGSHPLGERVRLTSQVTVSRLRNRD